MRALQCDAFGPVQDIRLSNCDEPGPPVFDEVLVEVAYASVSHAVGLMIEGKYQTRPPRPFVPGTEAVGRVIAVGERVTRLAPGDRVAVIARWGCYAERIRLREHTVYPIPEALALQHALPVPISYGTAFTALLWRCGLQPGEAVLVLGAGSGVGFAAVELAALMGADVIACASTPSKRQAALAAGARAAVEPSDTLADRVKALTGGRGADVIVDPVGGELFGHAVRAAAPNARLLSIGFASGALPQVQPNLLLVKNLSLHGFFYGRYIGWTPKDESAVHAPALQRAMNTMLDWAVNGRIKPEVSRIFPIDRLPEALEALHGRQVIGKVALAIKTEENEG